MCIEALRNSINDNEKADKVITFYKGYFKSIK